MTRIVMGTLVLMSGLALTGGAHAASFDCKKATTPFEKVICDSPDLSKADEDVAVSYKAALEGLSAGAGGSVKQGQRDWLNFAQRACTHDAEPLTKGKYDEDGIACLQSVLTDRVEVLKTGQTTGGMRFYPVTSYGALKDDQATADMPYWVGTSEINAVKIDGDDEVATAFNAVIDRLLAKTHLSNDGQSTEDVMFSADVASVTPVRIGLAVGTYDFGHGAAHGNSSSNTLNFLLAEKRELVASDVFTGKDWEGTLRKIVVSHLTKELGEDLQLDDPSSIDGAIIDPTRWDFSDAGLIVQFQPYEVSYYAMGAPTVTVPWDELKAITTDEVDGLKSSKLP